jgi:hypothetical protein
VTDFLADKRLEITNRLNELKPLVDEYARLEAAATALAGIGGSTGTKPTAPPSIRRPGRPPGSGRKKAPMAGGQKRRASRRKGSGSRTAETLSLVQGQPGITIPELAAKMNIKQNYLYRVLPGLEEEGKVQKQGRGWHPKPTKG